MPDWRDASAYPGQSASPLRWRWEFRRRLSEYREDWRLHYGPSFEARRREWQKASPRLPPDLATWERLNVGWAEMPDCLSRWAMTMLLDPTVPEPHFLASAFQEPVLLNVEDRSGGATISYPGAGPSSRREVRLYGYDITLPLEPQMEAARQYLLTQQGAAKTGRDRRDKWPQYLRAVDAHDAGEKLRRIAEVVFGSATRIQSVQDALEAARAIGCKGSIIKP